VIEALTTLVARITAKAKDATGKNARSSNRLPVSGRPMRSKPDARPWPGVPTDAFLQRQKTLCDNYRPLQPSQTLGADPVHLSQYRCKSIACIVPVPWCMPPFDKPAYGMLHAGDPAGSATSR
jgi:hypothetical protein